MASNSSNFFRSPGGRAFFTVAIALILWGIMAVFLLNSDNYNAICIIAGLCAFCGWQSLSRIQPVMFVWMSWAGMLTYILVKLFLSIIIGVVVAPYILGKKIGDLLYSRI